MMSSPLLSVILMAGLKQRALFIRCFPLVSKISLLQVAECSRAARFQKTPVSQKSHVTSAYCGNQAAGVTLFTLLQHLGSKIVAAKSPQEAQLLMCVWGGAWSGGGSMLPLESCLADGTVLLPIPKQNACIPPVLTLRGGALTRHHWRD